jgi:hypothetical protein
VDTSPHHVSLANGSRKAAERIYLGMTLAAMLLLLVSLWVF